MTCIAAYISRGGPIILAADSRVTWRSEEHDDGQCAYLDELQKIYGLSHSCSCALSGDVSLARDVLTKVRRWGHTAGRETPTGLSNKLILALLRHALYLALRRVETVNLIVASIDTGGPKLFTWKSSGLHPAVREMPPGQAVVLGSITRDECLTKAIQEKLDFLASATLHGAPLSPEDLAMATVDNLTQLLQGDRGKAVGVGGLFQVASFDQIYGFVGHGYDTRSFTAGSTCGYSIRMSYDGITHRWVQENLLTGVRCEVFSLDDQRFKRGRPSPARSQTVTW